jgi:hypothetical protein
MRTQAILTVARLVVGPAWFGDPRLSGKRFVMKRFTDRFASDLVKRSNADNLFSVADDHDPNQ